MLSLAAFQAFSSPVSGMLPPQFREGYYYPSEVGPRLGASSFVEDESDDDVWTLKWKEMQDELGLDIESGEMMDLEDFQVMGNHEDFDEAVDELEDLHEWMGDALVDPIEQRDWAQLLEALDDPWMERLNALASDDDSEEDDSDEDVLDTLYSFPDMHKWLGDDVISPLADRDFETVVAALNEDPFDFFDDESDETADDFDGEIVALKAACGNQYYLKVGHDNQPSSYWKAGHCERFKLTRDRRTVDEYNLQYDCGGKNFLSVGHDNVLGTYPRAGHCQRFKITRDTRTEDEWNFQAACGRQKFLSMDHDNRPGTYGRAGHCQRFKIQIL